MLVSALITNFRHSKFVSMFLERFTILGRFFCYHYMGYLITKTMEGKEKKI